MFVERLDQVSLRHHVHILAWVVMPEHVHLIAFPEEPVIGNFLVDLKSPFSQKVISRWRELNAMVLERIDHADGPRFWQAGGGYDRVVMGDELLEKIRYTHRNPITRGLAASSIDYPFSSARAYENLPTKGPTIALDLLPRFDHDGLT